MSRSKRLEFTKPVKLEIFRRAGGPGNPCCEKCKMNVLGKRFEYDHILECWEMEDVEHGYRTPLTAADGRLLCGGCHDGKTARKSGERAYGKRIVEKSARIDRRKGRNGLSTKFSRRFNGDIVNKETGEIIRRGKS